MAEQFLIEDGYTIDGNISRAEGIHPALKFTYRPALSSEVNAYLKGAVDPDKRTKRQAELVVAHVLTWNVTSKAGQAHEKPTLAIAEKLQPTLLTRLVDVITGYASSGEEDADRKNS